MVKLTQLWVDTRALVQDYFVNKVRKSDGVPYLAHLWETVGIVGNYMDIPDDAPPELGGENILCAAFAHDLLEDTPCGVGELTRYTNPAIAKLVLGLSEDKSKTWRARKKEVAEQAGLRCQAHCLIRMADKISSMRATVARIAVVGPTAFWAKFNAPCPDQLWANNLMAVAFFRNARLGIDNGHAPVAMEYAGLRTDLAYFEFSEMVAKVRSACGDLGKYNPEDYAEV
jgi:hypothetical protein